MERDVCKGEFVAYLNPRPDRQNGCERGGAGGLRQARRSLGPRGAVRAKLACPSQMDITRARDAKLRCRGGVGAMREEEEEKKKKRKGVRFRGFISNNGPLPA
ncbi:hypothetical protein EYF80_031067 [Liparis tanakae]|uniref:Uncharacterized protein n=1 Tax=Liparis tanakae TaxID=230148 RepID=A0A4Z2H1H1_9TELE|nr:hypothetical protein EYF80_031067 [Liparis tanakae]